MLPLNQYGRGEPALVMMPFLGGSQREWSETVTLLREKHECITVDLPGFGAAADVPGYSVEQMSDAVIDVLSVLKADRYVLIGHSMAGKVSAVAARKIIEGALVSRPAGMVLVAPSPPAPEPMKDSKREAMLQMFGDGVMPGDRASANEYIQQNLASAIPSDIFERTVDEVLRMDRAAWVAWLTSGSKEDWASFVGVLDVPALVLAGDNDEALGPAAQREFTLPHFGTAELRSFDCSHLIPLERTAELVSAIEDFLLRI